MGGKNCGLDKQIRTLKIIVITKKKRKTRHWTKWHVLMRKLLRNFRIDLTTE